MYLSISLIENKTQRSKSQPALLPRQREDQAASGDGVLRGGKVV